MSCFGFLFKKYRIYPINFQKHNFDFHNDKCAICLEDFNKKINKIVLNKVILNCGHSFHSECILNWFERKMKCPYCETKYQWKK